MLLHDFFGEGKYSNRKASVFKEGDDYLVYMIQDMAVIEERRITGRIEQYAEDCAENWVLGVIQ